MHQRVGGDVKLAEIHSGTGSVPNRVIHPGTCRAPVLTVSRRVPNGRVDNVSQKSSRLAQSVVPRFAAAERSRSTDGDIGARSGIGKGAGADQKDIARSVTAQDAVQIAGERGGGCSV